MVTLDEIKKEDLEEEEDVVIDDLDELDAELDELDDLDIEVEEGLDIADIDIDSEVSTVAKSYKDDIGQYLDEIDHFPRLSREDEIELAKVIKAGIEAKGILTKDNEAELLPIINAGNTARDKFINANYKLVVAVAKRFMRACSASLTFLDIIQYGNLGLMTAVDRFDHTLGFKFSTYASYWIQQRIRREIINTSRTIRIPVHIHDWLAKIHNCRQQYPQISMAEMAEILETTVDRLDRLLHIQDNMGMVYLDQGRSDGDGEETSLLEFIASPSLSPAEINKIKELDNYVFEVLSTRLTDREQYIISRRFGLTDSKPATLEVLGKEFGVSRERIRQIESKAMRKLKSERVQQELRQYLGFR
jgi:RNA polymerase primary sigma factor